ncbi:MAG: polysaccharide deacetylase [Butyrivibrio sp.]|nr:polysaccharide deacetylase [Butyrivibrio sp.]
MSGEGTNENAQRKCRVKLYKRIIVITIVFIIILPTILCVILFFRMSSMHKEIKDLRAAVEGLRTADSTDGTRDSDYPEETPAISENVNTPNKADSPTKPEGGTQEEMTQPQNAATEAPTAEQTTNFERETTAEQVKPDGQQALVDEALAQGRKVVYLTFDDGPCGNTVNLLDALDAAGVKATFFINGHTGFEDQLKRMVEEGHTLAMHTYTHEYEHVYRNLDTFGEEIATLQQYIYDVTGTSSYIFRFPGGSSNSKAKLPISDYIDYLNENNLVYYDWNVSSGDGSDGLTAAQVYDNVMSGIANNDVSVVLMHDSTYKMSTFEAVPRIIESLQAMNALILPITYDTAPVHHNVK